MLEKISIYLLTVLAVLWLTSGCSNDQSPNTQKEMEPDLSGPTLNAEDAKNALVNLLFDKPDAFGDGLNQSDGLAIMKCEVIRDSNLNVIHLNEFEVNLQKRTYLRRGIGVNQQGTFKMDNGKWIASMPQQSQ